MLNKIIKLSKKFIKIPSVSPYDLGCQKIIFKRLKKIGFTIENININKTNNLLAFKGKGKTLIFLGHTDVVPVGNIKKWKTNPFNPIIINDFLFGRGISDMKGSLAAMIVATESYIQENPFHKGRISFLITSDEESSGNDGTVKVVKILKKRKEMINYCLVGEPTSNTVLGDVIKNGRRGSLNVNLIIYGKQGHIAYPNLAENPIHKILNFVHQLVNFKWDKGNNYFQPSVLQISYISSGIKNITNVIPDFLKINFNIRYNTEINKKIIIFQVKKFLLKYNLKYKIKWVHSAKPFITKSGKLLKVVKKSIYKYNSFFPVLSTSGGTSDGRFFSDMNTEIIELGLVNKTIHKVNECVKIKDLLSLSIIYKNILKNIFI
ncbi:MAG: succinyl-diaminopimelate desuccinylase [Buchnera aphidicola (Periphyllus lyropictus)]|uniref:succinyl-diaminopimelate desuccinylase n=1 Tax=Buchnera aphidicola TaxID=9 RepID=UPI001ECD3539|nr:succinyl-diaminopimelate desuccinylase [Buchnera aphidicola]NIH16737.1 succinyl-diaminopimelate desuccinylase [Buchnera aphidicola (Periphyllus lyropictus)]USS94637.1 succinyl-diaminopimelate desuccinylase [Buchnera aphidicola (Periphyllus lyropictus)]